jgi:uncharacterized membrane protein YfcA
LRHLLLGAAALTFVASFFVMRIVIHLYREHGHLDLFHLIIGVAAALIGVVLFVRVLRMRPA